MLRMPLFVALCWFASLAVAADTVIYDDASQNGFDQNCSFGGVAGDFDFANATPVHTGIASIRFTPDAYNAVSWCAPATYSATADFPGITFWVYVNSDTQGANIDLALINTGTIEATQSLQNLYGGPIPASTWVQVQTTFADAALMNYGGPFDQIALQDQTGVDVIFSSGFEADTPSSVVYFDDVVLQAAAVAQFRGTNVPGMETSYTNCLQAGGPVADFNYPSHDTRLIDYFAGKNMTAIRYLFTWECMQPTLGDPIPDPGAGANYQTYFDNYQAMVDYATNTKGMQVIIEPWQANSGGGAGGAMYGGVQLTAATHPTYADFADFWGKIATLFKDNPKVSYGLVNEPNNTTTTAWFDAAQAAITAIRDAGSTQRIYVPGVDYTAASAWTSNGSSTAFLGLTDPASQLAVELHDYVDVNQGGLDCGITSLTAAEDQLSSAVTWGRNNLYQIYVGEIAVCASNANAATAWQNFVTYFNANTDVLAGFTWWAGGYPDWWTPVDAPYFSISPTSDVTFTGDTANMTMIQGSF
jgi:endoglucanase